MKRRKGRSENGFEEWGGYMNAKKTKLAEQFDIDSSKAGLKVDDLFRDIKIFVNGYTEPSADELRLLMMKHGGQYHHYLKTGVTTHIIASNLPDSKVDQAKHNKIVKPDWITDSIKEKKLLPYQNYLLITNRSTRQGSLNFPSKSSKAPEDRSMRSTTDAGFIDEFYANSRLHHISTMGATFKEYINKLRSDRNHSFHGRNGLIEKYPRSERSLGLGNNVVMHIDMDCFFVSVGLRDKAHLIGKPVAVTHSKGGAGNARDGVNLLKEIELYRKRLGYDPAKLTGQSEQFCNSASMAEIASCSYEARQCGIKNGMFVGQALKLCPQLHFIHYDFDAYNEVSYSLYDSVARYTLDIEAVSCDEMYVDLSSLFQETSVPPMEFAKILRSEILGKTGCPSSVGFGSNKLIARLATKKAKPNGQFWIQDDQILSFLNELPLSDLPGVGRSTSHKLKDLGIQTCGDLQSWTLQELQRELGKKQGETLYNACRGKDLKGLSFHHVRKSVSADVNYGIRLKDDVERDTFLTNLSGEVAKRLSSIQMKGRCVTLKLMVRSSDAPEETAKYMGHGVCDHITKSTTLLSPIYSPGDIFREVQKIIRRLNVEPSELRGIGIQMSRLEPFAGARNKLMDFISANASKPKSDVQQDKSSTTLKSKAEKVPSVGSEPKRHNDAQKKAQPEQRCPSKSEGLVGEANEKRKDSNEVDSFLSPADLRVMIGKWVESEERPREKDKKIILGYLQQLCTSHQIEDLFLILKWFFTYVKRYRASPRWITAYQYILDSVQTTMVSHFGGPLKMDQFTFKNELT